MQSDMERANVMREQCANRESALNAIRNKGMELVRKGKKLMALADALNDIERSATDNARGQDARHPYIGVGSDAEEALWELVVHYRG